MKRATPRPLLIPMTLIIMAIACEPEVKRSAQDWVDLSITAHGLAQLEGKTVAFDFRDHAYSVRRREGSSVYTRLKNEDSISTLDSLWSSGRFRRYVNDRPVELVDSMKTKYSESVNSVAYFFQLPLPLNDPAAIKQLGPEVEIRGQPYQTVEVTFRQAGGGKDFEDEFRYWFHAENFTLDYLAYSYATDGGGIRFRVATREHHLSGMKFQDYENYKPLSKRTPLDSLPLLWEAGKLELLSKIENTNLRLLEGR